MKIMILFATVFAGIFSFLINSHAAILCSEENELAQRADLIVMGEVVRLAIDEPFTETEGDDNKISAPERRPEDALLPHVLLKHEPEKPQPEKPRRMRAVMRVDKLIQGTDRSPEIYITFHSLDKTLEPDVQDKQLTVGLRGRSSPNFPVNSIIYGHEISWWS